MNAALWAVSVLASAAEPPEFVPDLVVPIQETAHPQYRDATGRAVHWREIKKRARGTRSHKRVRQRRLGRTVLRITFAGVTALEVWGTWRLAQNQNVVALPLGVQAGLTGLCGVLLWTSVPQQRDQDRALLLRGANSVL